MTKPVILITGAGGFVCSEIAIALDAAGYEVVATDQLFDPATTARLAKLRRIEGPLDQVLQQLTDLHPIGVIHGAAITASPDRLGISNARHVRQNTDLLTQTLDWARSNGAQRFLFLSSMGVFEPTDGPLDNGTFSERTKPSGTIPYCAAKRAGELLTAGAADKDFTTLSLRLGNIFGPHEAVRPTRQMLCLVSRMMQAARMTGVIRVDAPRARREWAWLPDLAAGIAQLMGQFPDVDMIHAGTPPPMNEGDLAKEIARRISGTTVVLGRDPATVLRPPMSSHVTSALSKVSWTSVTDALDTLMTLEPMS